MLKSLFQATYCTENWKMVQGQASRVLSDAIFEHLVPVVSVHMSTTVNKSFTIQFCDIQFQWHWLQWNWSQWYHHHLVTSMVQVVRRHVSPMVVIDDYQNEKSGFSDTWQHNTNNHTMNMRYPRWNMQGTPTLLTESNAKIRNKESLIYFAHACH